MSSDALFKAPELEELRELLPLYDIEAFIAQGGMGAVYKARQKSLDRGVAIKILPRQFGADETFRKNFEAEAVAMAKVNDANLIGVYDFGEIDGMLFIVMEYVHGKSLHHSAHGKVIDQREAARITHGICKGLVHAHEAGILHRDIKPANILLDRKKNPKIGDFGLASTTEAIDPEDPVFGTPGYTAPEVLNDQAVVDKRSDIFSTGVILYELLTGELPGTPCIPASRKQAVDPRFDTIIRRATHPSAAMRYPDAKTMQKELARLLEDLDGPAATSPVATASVPEAATVVARSTSAPKALIVAGEKAEPARLTTSGSSSPSTSSSSPAAGSSPATGSSSPAPPPVVHIAHGHNWSFLRNLLIIVALLVAIFGMSKALDWKKRNNARKEQEQREEADRLKYLNRVKAEQLRREAAAAGISSKGPGTSTGTPRPEDPPVPPRDTPVEPPVEPPVETPLDALARLQSSLSGGDRTEFPPGTFRLGSFSYFFVDSPMNWALANTFAEEHGGQLATLPSESGTAWLASKIPDTTAIWLGGGTVGSNNWGWADGTNWNLATLSSSIGTAASLSDRGTLSAKSPGELLPFFIQWHMDGSTPAALKAQLERASKTLEANNPAWPPGTLSFGSRRYLIVARPGTWNEGASLARLAGGHLTVPSDDAESDYLLGILRSSLAPGSACWIGGQHNKRDWAWTTGESWTFAAWADGSPDGDPARDSALRILIGKSGGWDDADPSDDESAASFIIEWSKDPTSGPKADNPASRELVALRKKALNAVTKVQAPHKKELFKNGKSLKWDLDFWLRGNHRDAILRFTPDINALKNSVTDSGRIPGGIEPEGLPLKPIQIFKDAIARQQRLEEKLHQDLNRIRLSYLQLLEGVKDSLEQSGLTSQVRDLDNEISACGTNGREFLELFVP